jgi:PrtD family type I secretion system ABC transporter
MSSFLRHCRPHFLFAGLFSLIINVLQLTVPLYMLQVFDRVLTSRSYETLVALSLVAAGALMVSLLLDLLRARLLLAAGVTLDGLASSTALTEILQCSGQPRNNLGGAELKDVSTLRSFLTGPGVIALFDAPWAPLYLGVIFLFHPQLGWIATLGAITLFLLACVNERLTRRPLDEMSAAARRAAREIDGGVRNAEIVNVLGLSGDVKRRWHKLNHAVIDAQVRAAGRGNLIGGLTKFARLLIQVLMLAAGALLVLDHVVTGGVMITGTLILARALSPVENAIITWKGLVEAREAYRRLQQLLTTGSEVKQRTRLPAPQGRVVADRLTYAPPGAESMLLKGISFALEPGESLGLIGPSGSGKSTLARVLTGWLNPSAGALRLDGADIADWPRLELGPHLGYLPQDAQLFSGTVAENIGRLSEASSAAIIDAAKRAYAHEMILALPNGYDTVIGDAGVALSGGQRQRIALARALFGNPRFIVLDEPNANLDTEGEQALLSAMRDVTQAGVTLIVISHRPSLLAHVDKLLVLNTGRVEAFGPRNQIMQKITPVNTLPKALMPHLVAGGVK